MDNGFAHFYQLIRTDMREPPHKHVNPRTARTDRGYGDTDQLCVNDGGAHKQAAPCVVVGRLALVGAGVRDVRVITRAIKKAR